MKTLFLTAVVVFVAVPASAQMCTSQRVFNTVYTSCLPPITLSPPNPLNSGIILGIQPPTLWDLAVQQQQLEVLRLQTELLRQQLPAAPPPPPKVPKAPKAPRAAKASRRPANWMDAYIRSASR